MLGLIAVVVSSFFILYSLISLSGEYVLYSGVIGFLVIVVILLFSFSE